MILVTPLGPPYGVSATPFFRLPLLRSHHHIGQRQYAPDTAMNSAATRVPFRWLLLERRVRPRTRACLTVDKSHNVTVRTRLSTGAKKHLRLLPGYATKHYCSSNRAAPNPARRPQHSTLSNHDEEGNGRRDQPRVASFFIFLLLRRSLPPSVPPLFADHRACFLSFLFTAINLSFSTR